MEIYLSTPTHAIPLGPFEWIGAPMNESEAKAGFSYIPFDLGKEYYIKVGRVKFKKEFFKLHERK